MAVLKKVNASLVTVPRIGERLRAQAISPPVLEHEGILTLRSIVLAGDEVWIIRDYSQGAPLDQHLSNVHAAGIPAAARQFCGLLEAFAYAHRRGFHHLNLRMSNIRVESGRMVAADFTISRLFGVSAVTRELLGAPDLRPPEQALGEEMDARSDVYSLGKILLAMGAKKDSALPDWLLPVVAKATETDPQARYRTAAEFREALSEAIPESAPMTQIPLVALASARPVAAAPARIEPPAPPPARRGFGIPMAAGLALAVGSASLLWNFHRSSETAASADSSAAMVLSSNLAPSQAPARTPEKAVKPEPVAAARPAAVTPVPVPQTAPPAPAAAVAARQPKAREFVWNRPANAPQEVGAPALPAAQVDVTPRSAAGPPPVSGVETRVAPPPEPAPEPAQAAVQPAPAQRVSGKLVGARLVRGGSPTYPPFAKQLKVSGTVRLEVRIAPDGKVSGVRTIAGHPVLAGAAMDAARRWVYAPATLDGAPIASTTQVDISFTSK